MKKIIAWLLVIVLTAGAAIGGTLAYLTDRDSEANVFTVGDVSIDLNEKFQQGAELIPGVDIEKEATITNTGKNDAWVWLTVLLPEEMGPYTAPDNMSASNNVVHWNYPAASAPYITVDFNSTPVDIDTDGDGVTESYYQTNMLWKEVLKAGETTGAMLSKVYMDKRVDIDPEGNMHWVVDGVATDLGWNVNEKGNPVIHVSAYAIQAEGFETVEAAYAAYQTQWGDNSAEYGEPVIPIDSEANLKAAAESGGYAILMADINVSSTTYVTADLTLDMNGHTISDVDEAEVIVMLYASKGATLTITGNGTVYSEDHNQFMLGAASGSEIIVENGSFIKAPYEWGKDCGYDGCTGGNSHTSNAQNLGPVIWSKGVITVYDGYFDCGILNSDYVEKNSDPVVHDCMYPTINLSIDTGSGHVFIYGGTFVNANPVDGDDNPRGSSDEGNQNATEKAFFLYGQTEYGVIPDGYTITEGTDEYGRVTHTVSYNGN